MSLGFKVIAADMLLEKDLPESGSKESMIITFGGKGCLINDSGRDFINIRLNNGSTRSFNRSPFKGLVNSIIEVLN